MDKEDSPYASLRESKIRNFKKEIWDFYAASKRDSLPWRQPAATADPYRILVSEVMLQQTQVSRVIVKYEEFLKKFPTIKSLALASNGEVIQAWQGLGYNRRALFLKRACEAVYTENPGKPQFPADQQKLEALPGIGQSTAGAILAFAFNKPAPFIETNIRSVFLYFFFKGISSVSDKTIFSLVEQTMDAEKPREWYYALYDYGSMLKARLGKHKTTLHRQSKHYSRQSAFKGSNREIRSAILKLVLQGGSAPYQAKGSKAILAQGLKGSDIREEIISKLPQATPENIESNLHSLVKEGFLSLDNDTYRVV